VKLARWEERGYYALRASADKAQRALHKLQRRAAAALAQPAAAVLAAAAAAMGLPDLAAPELPGAAGAGPAAAARKLPKRRRAAAAAAAAGPDWAALVGPWRGDARHEASCSMLLAAALSCGTGPACAMMLCLGCGPVSTAIACYSAWRCSSVTGH